MQPVSSVCHVCGTVNQMGHVRCLTCGHSLVTANNSTALPSAPPVFMPANNLLNQRYRVIRVAGKGGMGTVYIGKDTHLGNRLVAIKEMSQSGLSPSERLAAARNFKREAHLLAGLQHPHLPSIYDHFAENQRWYLVMSFVNGQTLNNYLQAKGSRLAIEEVLEIGIVLCNVLSYLHTRKTPIIFRDLKPSNIMRTIDGHIYLIDFGVARFFKPGLTKDTSKYGTSGYAPPEQYGTAQTTPRSDIYSLGVTLHQLLSGYEPANSPFRLPPLQQILPTAPVRLVTLITQMLNLEEQNRPASAAIVKRELQSIASSINSTLPLPISVDVPPSSSRPTKRRKGLLATLIIAGIIVIATMSYFLLESLNPLNPNTPDGIVNTFCTAMNSPSPDFQTAYHQFSRAYQRQHSLLQFQEYFQGTSQCTVASSPDRNNQAGISLTIVCPRRPPPPNGLPPHPSPPPPLPSRNPVDLTLIDDGNNGWKIDTIYVVGYRCDLPPRPSPPGQP